MNAPLHYDTIDSPFGPFLIAADSAVRVARRLEDGAPHPNWRLAPALLRRSTAVYAAYFAGALTDFESELELRPQGTPFQQAVWNALRRVGYGDTTTYASLAAAAGNPAAARAVGAAMRLNPIAVAVPCHRVVGSNGKLTGYRGGLAMKRGLLELERRVAAQSPLLAASRSKARAITSR